MATANKNNVRLRSQQSSPLTHAQADTNFNELRKVIDDVVNLEVVVEDIVGGATDVLTSMQEDIDDLAQVSNVHTGKISSLESTQTTHNNRLNNLDNAVNNTQQSVTNLSVTVSSNTAGIQAVNTRIDNLPAQTPPPPTNLGATPSSDKVTITSSTGGSATIPLATTTNAGLFAPAEKTKLNSMGTMGQRNVTISTANPSGGSNGDIWIKV